MIPKNTCNADISIQMESNQQKLYSLSVVFFGEDGKEETVILFSNRTANSCQRLADLTDVFQSVDASSMRLVVSTSEGGGESLSVQIKLKTFCPVFDTVYNDDGDEDLIKSLNDAHFVTVSSVQGVSCGMHYWNNEKACDWLRVGKSADGGNGFKRVDSNACTDHGSDETHFLELQGAEGEDQTALLVLPLQTNASKVRVSFWSLIKCHGPYIDLSVVKNIDELENYPISHGKRSKEIFEEYSWHFHTTDIDVPKSSETASGDAQKFFVSLFSS